MMHDNETPRDRTSQCLQNQVASLEKMNMILNGNIQVMEKRLINREAKIAELEQMNQVQAEMIRGERVEPCPTSDPLWDEVPRPNGDGFKFDGGKNRMGYVMGEFPRAFAEICRIGSDGGAIHGDGNWCRMPNAFNRWMDAHYRHLNKFHRGETIDTDSHSTHLGHAAWSAMALLEMHIAELEGYPVDNELIRKIA